MLKPVDFLTFRIAPGVVNHCWTELGEWYSENEGVLNIMQYSGFKDKNDVEIYEGDIVECHVLSASKWHFYLGKIQFVDGCFEVKLKAAYPLRREYLKCFVANHAIEIKGNIHENPELIAG